MRIGLDDNTRDALQFVLLGAGIVLVLRLLVAGIGLMLAPPPTDDLAAIIATFRNGYLLNDPHILVTGGMDLPGRLAIAGLSALVGGIGLAVLFALIARVLGRDARKGAVQGGRTGLLLVASWGLYAALLLPAHSARVGEQGITITHRSSVLDGVCLPWSAEEQVISWRTITNIEHRSIASSLPGCGSQEQVVVVSEDGERVIASLTPRGPDCAASTRDAVDRTTRLAALLRSAKDR